MNLLLLGLLLAPAAETATRTITVTAPQIAPETVAPAARDYVNGVLPIPVLGQYALWKAPICIKVVGVEAAIGARVSHRIAETAQGANIPVAGAGCTPNLIVWFSPDARRDVAAILGKRPASTNGISPDDRQRLLDAPMPVRWWHTLEAGGSDGSRMTSTPSGTTTAQYLNSNETATGVGGPQAASTSGYSASLIDTHISIGIIYAAAAVDIPLTTGRSLDSVASYVAMVTLAPIPLSVMPPAVPSILGLFAAPAADTDVQLTSWDKAYLGALASMAPNRKANRQRGQLVTAMIKAMQP